MAETSTLQGSCACDRNQYQIELPPSSVPLASVFFDNSAQSRRSQASPVTAWLRVPLEFYHSATVAQLADETHASIRRTYTTKNHPSTSRTTRRQFCGYCGTHLTAFDESQTGTSKVIDITLGSLADASLDQLQELKILPGSGDADEDEEEELAETPEQRLVLGGTVDNDKHIASTALQKRAVERISPMRTALSQYMQHRGMPYFEEMIENSSLGRIRRQRGGHVSDDGRTKVHWEIVEFNEDDETTQDSSAVMATNTAKRVKLGL